MALLEVRGLCKSFGHTEVLRGIDLDLECGEVMAILGASGSGKTTLLRCLNFLEIADRGTISVGGEVLFDGDLPPEKNLKDVRNKRLHFGLVFQSFNLFPQYNCLDNVTLALKLQKKKSPDEIKDIGMRLLDRVGLADKLGNYPCQLSGGQQQRVAIARALALSPDVLCFDEPTSALDPELTGEVLKVIRGLKCKDNTMVVVTHEMDFARNVADKIVFMADGIVEETGTPEEVFGNPRSPRTAAFLSKVIER
ncbi:MAG: amino acid ABC transporter ATP-binding protein [Clostridia bacterium]|nr:amino acid ABC transporter ATP-binding protein [Clostridia bacterium]